MNNSDFDNMFSSTLNQDAAYYTDTAMNYLAELEDLKDRFVECSKSLRDHQTHIDQIYQAVNKYKTIISVQKAHLFEKDREIASLRAQLQKQGVNWSPVDLREIEFKVKALEQRIKLETEHYHKTGRYSSIEQTINEVRHLFNNILQELNKANAQNQSVESLLRTLLTLEVNFLFLKN